MDETEIKYFVEAALLAAGRPLTIDQLQGLFDGRSTPEKSELRKAISSLVDDYEHRGITVAEVASGFRMQIKASMSDRLQKLWEERPPRYSRALFETLALIAYRQPITRGEIEEIRGVSVSTNIVRSLHEREWIRVVGHRDVPGRPAMFGTTRLFLDYFGLKKLDDLPPLADLSDWESLRVQLNLPAVVDSEDQQPVRGEVTEIPMQHEEFGMDEASIAVLDDGTIDVERPGIDDQYDDRISDAESPPVTHENGDLEELVATEWPDPVEPPSIVPVADTDSADVSESHEETDATVTGG